MRNEDGCDGVGADAGSAVNEGVESGAAAGADAARTDADQTESPAPSVEEEKREEQDSNSSTTSDKATKTSSKCEGFFCFSILVLLCFLCSFLFVHIIRALCSSWSVSVPIFLFCFVRI